MEAFPPDAAVRKLDPFTKLMTWPAGIDEETLRQCPAHDWDNVRAIGMLMLFVWAYQAGLLGIVAHELLAPDGEFHPDLTFGAAFIATLVLLIDSYGFLRAGFHAEGIQQLARGGLDLAGGLAAKIKAGIFLGLRILLSLGFAQLSAVFVALILFKSDITAEIERFYREQNRSLIASVSLQTDADIARAADVTQEANARVEALQKQVASMRDGSINPAASDTAIQAEQAEISELLAEKGRRDTELVAAQSFAANELAGVKGDPSNSGVPGRGPVRAAAEERVRAATANDEAANQALAEARTRLDNLRKQALLSADDRARQAQRAVPHLESDLEKATDELTALREHQAKLVRDRNETIRTGIETAPERVGRDTGFLARLSALRRVARDPEIAMVIFLIDFTSFGLELAAVLAKVTSFIPTTYAVLLARNAFMQAWRTVDEMDAEMRRRPTEPEDEDDFLQPVVVPGVGGEQAAAGDHAGDAIFPLDGDVNTNAGTSDATEGKRPRGRPRKVVTT